MIPNLFTAGNLVCGVLAIILSLDDQLRYAPILIFIAALFDLLDGMIARALKVTSELGKQLDSLADMVTFGVAPGIIMYKIMFFVVRLENNDSLEWMVYIPIIIPVFAMFRLAKFNIDSKHDEHFIGLPTPAMTLFFAAFPLILVQVLENNLMDQFQVLTLVANLFALTFWIVLMSILMVAPIRMFSLKFKHGKWKDNEIRYIFLTMSLILLATVYWWALPIIIIMYVLLSILSNLLSRKDATSN